LKGDLSLLPGESLLAAPGGIAKLLAAAGNQSIGESRQADSCTAEKEAFDKASPAAGTPFAGGALSFHDGGE
jgi:hypothetical protein